MIVYTYLHAAGNRVNESYYFLYVFVKLMSPNHDTTLTLMSWQIKLKCHIQGDRVMRSPQGERSAQFVEVTHENDAPLRTD